MGNYASTQGTGGMVNDIDAAKTNGDIVEYILNGIYDSSEGTKGSIHSESGTERQLLTDYTINGTTYLQVGHISLTPDKKVIFLTNNVGNEALAYFIKGKITLIREFTGTEIMGFNTKYPIQGIGRIRRGTDEVLYWNDGKNPDRYMIITKLDSYINGGLFNPDLTLFNQKFIPAQVELKQGYDTGGSFQIGAYRLGLQYGDSLGNFTETFYIGNPFHAVRGAWTGADQQIRGGFNILSANNGNRSDAYDVVNKSFNFDFTNVDTSYKTLRIFAIRYEDGDGTPTAVYQVRDMEINNRTTINWTFQGIDGSAPTISLDNLIASYARYSVSQAMHHIQNILIKANLQEKPYDWAKFQRYITRNAKVKWVVRDINIDDSSDPIQIEQDNKHAVGGWRNQSAIRGEVQTVGVSVLMTDGTKSPVFVVPAREAIPAGGSYTVGGVTYTPTTHYGGAHLDIGQRNTVAAGQSWDTAPLLIREDETPDVTVLGVPYLGFQINPETEVSISNVPTAGATLGANVERWRVYNTAIDDKVADIEAGYINSGITGYYEVDTRYPEIRDSEGEIIFPHTIAGAVVTMDKIRHHQFPDTDISPIHSYDVSNHRGGFVAPLAAGHHIHPMGIKVYDLVFPPEYAGQVAGVQFYYGDRSEDFTVGDKGFVLFSSSMRKNGELGNAFRAGSFVFNPGGGASVGTFNYDRLQFQSTGLQFDENYWSGTSYVRVERAYTNITLTNVGTLTAPLRIKGSREYHQYEDIRSAATNDHGANMLQYLNRNILTFDYEPFNINKHYDPTNGVVTNTQKELGINVREGVLGWNPANPGTPALIPTIWPKNQHFVAGDQNAPASVIGIYGHRFHTWAYVALRNTRDIFDTLQSITFHPATGQFVPVNTTYEVQGRDAFIVRNWFLGQSYNQGGSTGGEDGQRAAWMHEYFSESPLNADLRHEGTDTYEEVYPINDNIEDFIGYDSFNGAGGERVREFNSLNKDFAVLDAPQANFLLDLTTDWQSEKLGRFPVRVAWSGKSQDEELADLNLTFGALDYDDLSTDKGEIRMLAQKPNRLYAMTDYSVFLKPTNAQQLDLSSSTAFLKQSNFLDIAETELYDTGSGYGGCQHRQAHIHTEFGTLYVNQAKGEVYLLNKDIAPLTNKGLKHRLNDILPSQFLVDFEQATDIKYPSYDSMPDKNGLGIRCFYDPLWKRAIITKSDYEFKVPLEGILPVVPVANTLYWDVDTGKFNYNGIEHDLSDDDVITRSLWQRKHVTFSYDFEEQKWASYHSWMPRVGLNDTTHMYTQPLQHNNLFKHVKHNYLQFYDDNIRYPFVIEWNVSNFNKESITQLSWASRCGEWQEASNRYLNKKDNTFNQMIMYTDYHTTGLLDLVNLQDNPFAQFAVANNEKYIKRHQHVWKVNQLWDLRTVSADTEPAMTENINNANYADTWYQGLTGGYTDKAVNVASFDYTKSLFDIPSIDNEYVTTRLIYDNQDLNHRLSVDVMNLFKQNDVL